MELAIFLNTIRINHLLIARLIILHGRLSILKRLLELPTFLTTRKAQVNAITAAIEYGQLSILEHLLDIRAVPPEVLSDARVYKAMEDAISQNTNACIRRILGFPAIMTQASEAGYEILALAIRSSDAGLVSYLLDIPEILNFPVTREWFSIAADRGDFAICHEYLRRLPPEQLAELRSLYPFKKIASSIVQIQKDLSITYKYYLHIQTCLPHPNLAGPTRLINEYLFGANKIKVPDLRDCSRAIVGLFRLRKDTDSLLERTQARIDNIPDAQKQLSLTM